MLTKLTIRNFKLFEEVEVPLGSGFVLVGPNNCGKTSALQALTLWHTGLREWAEKHTWGVSTESGVLFISSKESEKWEKKYPNKRISPQLPVPPIFPPGSNPEEALINRLDLTSLPVSEADLLWLGRRHVRKDSNENIRIELIVEGETSQGRKWECGLEFGYANQESIFCRPLRLKTGSHPDWPIPRASLNTEIVFLPSMSGLTTEEPLIHEGRIRVLIGQGQPAGVLRNLCYRVCEKGQKDWNSLVQQIRDVFGIQLNKPEFSPSRGSLSMSYLDADEKTTLDITSCGRGTQQTLLLLAYIYDNPMGTVFLLDEPDAHLEIFRQRQIYDRINEVAEQRESQVIAASHSEALLNESAQRTAAVAFIGSNPHLIGQDKSAEVLKALNSIGFEYYYGAEQKGWIFYLEGETDLRILQAFAEKLQHPAKQALENPLVKYMGTDNPKEMRGHFSALKEAKHDLRGFLLMDRINKRLENRKNWTERMWKRREIENYLCNRTAILSYVAEGLNREDLFDQSDISERQSKMEKEIERLEEASKANREPSPFSDDFLDEVKTSDEFLVRLFMNFAESMGWPNSMALQKTDFDQLVKYIPPEEIDKEVIDVLDTIAKIAQVNSPCQK